MSNLVYCQIVNVFQTAESWRSLFYWKQSSLLLLCIFLSVGLNSLLFAIFFYILLPKNPYIVWYNDETDTKVPQELTLLWCHIHLCTISCVCCCSPFIFPLYWNKTDLLDLRSRYGTLCYRGKNGSERECWDKVAPTLYCIPDYAMGISIT